MRYEIADCPACGNTRAMTVRDHADVQAEFETLWQFHLVRMRDGAPVARLFDRTFFTQPPPLQLVTCCACGLLYRNPRERADRLAELYAEDEADRATLRALHEAQRGTAVQQARRLTDYAGRAGRGLEIGSYVGAFLAAAARHGWQFLGVDPNNHVNNFVRSLGLAVQQGSIEDVESDEVFDAVVFWNCFDQLPEPRAALRSARRLLRPGGILAIRVPNGAFYTRISRAPLPQRVKHAFLAWNNLLAFPYRHGFSPESLTRLLDAHGFEDVAFHRDSLVNVADAWTRPWARVEGRIVKAASRPAAPWFEIYARPA